MFKIILNVILVRMFVYIQETLNNILKYFNIDKLIKYLIRLLYGNCEISRICQSYHTSKMTLRFAKSLKKSKQCRTYRNIIYQGFNSFNVQSAVDNIITVKKISKNDNNNLIIITNITHCLHALKYVNVIMLRIDKLRKKSFIETNSDHLNLLESLWDNMKPDARRNNELIGKKSFISSDWGEIGFQGKDPTTDFRGCGLLGLIQLEYLAKFKSSLAKSILLDSMHNRRYYPYSATGINITAFIVELLNEHRFHALLFNCLQENELKFKIDLKDGPSADENLVNIGMTKIHELYCDIYAGFNKLWVKKDPENIMKFQEIFNEYKNTIRDQYPCI